MPRDVNGNMTLVAGNPVVSGTAISSTVHNDTIADLAAEIEDSLSRSGKGGMLVPMQFFDGTQAAPGAAFANESGTGWWRNGAGKLAISILGTRIFELASTGLSLLTGTLTLPNNSISRPALPTVGQQLSNTSSTFTHTGDTNWTDVTNVSSTITTTGRPVVLLLQCQDSNYGYISVSVATDLAHGFFRIDRTGTSANTIAETAIDVTTTGSGANPTTVIVPPSVISHIDPVPAGTYTYKLQCKCYDAGTTITVRYSRLMVYEL